MDAEVSASGRGAEPARIAVTLGDPRGIGPEVVASALADPRVYRAAQYVLVGPEDVLPVEPAVSGGLTARCEAVGRWAGKGGAAEAGHLSLQAIERSVELALSGEVDGLVTAPISKAALAAADSPYRGHTELLRDLCGVPEVTMIMAAEETLLGGPLRVVLLTTHIRLRDVPGTLSQELVVRRTAIAAQALREWWGIPAPRLAFAGVNPHASEDGLFGDEEERVLTPAARRLEAEAAVEVAGIFPADTVFRQCLDGTVDAVVVPYHDVGLAVLKTLAGECGVNVTAGIPFPRTSPDHGTAFDIAGSGTADPASMIAAMQQCSRFIHAAEAAGA